MSGSDAHRLANQALPKTVFDNPLAFARALSASNRIAGTTLTATLEQRGAYSIIFVNMPAPRELGDPAAIAIIGRGDGQTKFDTVAFYILELAVHTATNEIRFAVVSRSPHDTLAKQLGDGPLPDKKWFCDHAFELFTNRTPTLPTGSPSVPAWYWWHVFRAADAMKTFMRETDQTSQSRVVEKLPLLLLPEIAETAEELFSKAAGARLRQIQRHLRREVAFGPASYSLATMLANARVGSAAANLARGLQLVGEAREYMDASKAYALEAIMHAKLAANGIDVRENYEAAERLDAMARGETVPQRQRIARGTDAESLHCITEPTFHSLFLDNSELSYFTRGDDNRDGGMIDPTAQHYGGTHAGWLAWGGQETWPMWRLVDTRWLFPTAAAAEHFMHAVMQTVGDGLPAIPIAQLGDATMAFGSAGMGHVIVFRVGRIVGKLSVAQGPYAEMPLDQAMLTPFAVRAVQRAQWAQWQEHRQTTAALVRTLLDDRRNDMRANAAQAHALVLEMLHVDSDPMWGALEAECRSRQGT